MLPRFLQFPVYALDISDASYKYLFLEEKNDGWEVAGFGEGVIPKGVVEKGEILQKKVLADILRELFSVKKIKFAAVSLPEDKGYFRTLALEGVKEKEIKGAIELQLEEYVPLPPEEVVFDFDVVEKTKDGFLVFLRAFPRRVIESYLEAVREAGALPVFTESEVYSLCRSIVPKEDKEPVMIVDWGKTKISFSIVEGGNLRFVTTVLVGGRDLDSAISRSLKVDLKKAEELKITKGFVPKGDSLEVFEAMIPAVSSIMDELLKYKGYYETHSGEGSKIRRVLLAGGDANLLGLREHLERELKLTVGVGNPWVNVKFSEHYLPDLIFKDSLRFASVIGLSLGANNSIKKI